MLKMMVKSNLFGTFFCVIFSKKKKSFDFSAQFFFQNSLLLRPMWTKKMGSDSCFKARKTSLRYYFIHRFVSIRDVTVGRSPQVGG